MRALVVRTIVITGLFLTVAGVLLPQETTDPKQPALDTTHADHFGGYAFDYPSSWRLYPAELNTDQTISIMILQSQSAPDPISSDPLPAEASRIEFIPAFQLGDFPAAPYLAAWNQNNRDAETNEQLWEEDWQLFGEYYGIREQVNSQTEGETAILYFVFGNKAMMMVGYSNLQTFDAIARTLRPAVVGDVKTYIDEAMGYTFDYPADWQLEPAVYDDGQIGQINRVNHYNDRGILTAWIEFSPIFQFNDFDTLDEYAEFDRRMMENEGMGIQLRREDVLLSGGARGIRAINDTELAGQIALLYFKINGRAFVAAGYNQLDLFDGIAGSVRPAGA